MSRKYFRALVALLALVLLCAWSVGASSAVAQDKEEPAKEKPVPAKQQKPSEQAPAETVPLYPLEVFPNCSPLSHACVCPNFEREDCGFPGGQDPVDPFRPLPGSTARWLVV